MLGGGAGGQDDRPFAVAQGAAALLPARLEGDSSDLGWTEVLVRTYVDDVRAEEFTTMPVPDLLLVLVSSGTGVLEARGSRGWHRALYRPGVVGVTAPAAASTLRWATTSPDPMRSTHVHLSRAVLQETSAAVGVRAAGLDALDGLDLGDPFVRESLRLLGRATSAGASALYAGAVAQALASHVVELSRQGRSEPRPARGLSAAALRDVTAYMHAHLGEKVTLDDLAAVTHHSKHHFLRLFRTATGTTPHQQLTAIRMERAAALLRSGVAPLAGAHAVGYRSASQFAEAFRRAHGTTPGAYQAALAPSERTIPSPSSEEPVVEGSA